MNGASSQENGFSLMEVLVAFAILALGLLAIFNAYSLIVRGHGMSEREILALYTARSLIALAGTDAPLEGGKQSGQSAGGLQWTLEVVRLGSQSSSNKVNLYRVSVSVTLPKGSGKTQALTLSTIKTMGGQQ